MHQKDFDSLYALLQYRFQNPKTLELALVHKSYGNEKRSHAPIASRDNERLEFLGDAVLDLVISELLFESYPECTEGDLSKLRAGLVNEKALAVAARDLGLESLVVLGKGENSSGGRQKDSILASAFEALIAAIFIDGGFFEARACLRHFFASRIEGASQVHPLQDFKSKLQELVQGRFKAVPHYEILASEGPDHDKTFQVRVRFSQGKVTQEATATGKSRKEAEQNAAKIALDLLGSQNQ